MTRRSSIVCVFHVHVSLFPHRGGSGVSSANNREKRIKNELIFSSRRFSQLTKNRSISDFMLPSSETRGVRAGLLLSTPPKRSVNTRVSVTRLHIRLLSFQVSVALAVAPLGGGVVRALCRVACGAEQLLVCLHEKKDLPVWVGCSVFLRVAE